MEVIKEVHGESQVFSCRLSTEDLTILPWSYSWNFQSFPEQTVTKNN